MTRSPRVVRHGTRARPSPRHAQVRAQELGSDARRHANGSRAVAPKFLLSLLGAGHLPPYSTDVRQLALVQSVSTAFLDEYLKHDPHALQRMESAGDVPGLATMVAQP